MKTRKRIQKCKRYANEFCDYVREDLIAVDPRMKHLITSQNPAVKCFVFNACTDVDDIPQGVKLTPSGKFIVDGEYVAEESAIYIYNVFKCDPKELKRTVRHECIHFLLNKSGLPYKDTDEAFLCLAASYDARPYGLLYDKDTYNEIMKRTIQV